MSKNKTKLKRRRDEIKPGFFTIDVINAVVSCKTIEEAKAIAYNAVNSYSEHQAKPENISKAIMVINNSKSINKLTYILTNWMLAHPKENLKVI